MKRLLGIAPSSSPNLWSYAYPPSLASALLAENNVVPRDLERDVYTPHEKWCPASRGSFDLLRLLLAGHRKEVNVADKWCKWLPQMFWTTHDNENVTFVGFSSLAGIMSRLLIQPSSMGQFSVLYNISVIFGNTHLIGVSNWKRNKRVRDWS